MQPEGERETHDGSAPYRRDVIPTFRLEARRGRDSGARDRVLGVVLGAAVGDALGAPFEFAPRGTFSTRLPGRRPDGVGDMIGGGAFDWEPGEFTDDTQMGLALAGSLVARGGYDPDDLWERWKVWARTSNDVGNTICSALGHRDWRDVEHPDPEMTAGNGALMRAFPLAVATSDEDGATARSVTLHQSLLTHAHPAAAWGAWLGVAMMRAGVVGDDPLAALESELLLLSRSDPKSAQRFIAMLAPDWEPEDGDREGIGNGSVWGCLAQAVWALRRNDRFMDVLADAIDLGKDTDTVACVAGAIAGAREGASAIPKGWLGPVHGYLETPDGLERYVYEDLAELTLRLATGSSAD